METVVDQLFTDEIKKQGLGLFELGEVYKKLGDFESYVFEVYKDEQPFILRVTHQSHRQKEDILAELHWMNYLHSCAIKVPKVFGSVSGELVESIQASDGSHFYFCLFSKMIGSSIHVKDIHFNEKLFFAWGKAIGQIHEATRGYKEPKEIKRRPLWYEDDLLEIENYIPNHEKTIILKTKELIRELGNLPTTKEYFGLIHGDIHSGNIFFDGEHIHIFDFDDASYHWLASDLAIPLYYSVFYRYSSEEQAERNHFAERFMTTFIQGYETVTNLPPGWNEHLPLMLRLRDITLYSVLHKKIPIEQRDERVLNMLQEIGERIERNVTICKI